MNDRIARRVALRKYQEMLDKKQAAWELPGDPRKLPDMNTRMLKTLFDKKPEVREDMALDPTDYGHADYIPEQVKRPKE
jgi:hypothetical protein